MVRRTLIVGLPLLAVACAHAPVRTTATAYADALESGDLVGAYALTSPRYRARSSQADFAAQHRDVAARSAEAERLRATQAQLDAIAPELSDEAHPRIVAARAALGAFLDAAEARRFAAAYEWLSSDLKNRYSPSSLARDFSLAPDAGERLRRARVALDGTALETDAGVRFPMAAGRAVLLVEESGGFRVAALE